MSCQAPSGDSLCVLYMIVRARADLLTTSCDERALQTPHAWPYVDNVRRRGDERDREIDREKETSRRGESSDAEEATRQTSMS